MTRYPSGAEAHGLAPAEVVALHGRMKTDRATFTAAVENCREWDEAGLILGECPLCHSTLAFEVEVLDVSEERAA